MTASTSTHKSILAHCFQTSTLVNSIFLRSKVSKFNNLESIYRHLEYKIGFSFLHIDCALLKHHEIT